MKAEELRGKSTAELNSLHAAMRKEQFNLRFQVATGEMANTSRFRELRRDIARILTILAQAKKTA